MPLELIPYEDLSRISLERCAADIPRLGFVRAVERHFGRGEVARFLVDDRRAGFLNLIDAARPGACAVEIGAGFGALLGPLARRYERVIAIEPDAARGAFARAWLRDQKLLNVEVRGDTIGETQLAEESCDLIVFNGSLEWVPTESPRRPPIESQRAALAKAYRALVPGGQLYLAIENRFAAYALAGHPEPHTGMPFQSVVPRFVADRMAANRMTRGGESHEVTEGRPRIPNHRRYLTRTYGLGGYRKILRGVGFLAIRVTVPWPSYNRPEIFAETTSQLRQVYKQDTLHRPIGRLAGCCPHLAWWLAPGFAFVARKESQSA